MTQLRFRQEKQSNKFRVTEAVGDICKTLKQVQGDRRMSQGDGFVRVTGERVQGDRRMSQGDKV